MGLTVPNSRVRYLGSTVFERFGEHDEDELEVSEEITVIDAAEISGS